MAGEIIQLHPPSKQTFPLAGLYLNHNLRQYAIQTQQPFVYGNFITSLDGRIAIPHPSKPGPSKPGLTVPPQTANSRDWRLFQELAVQADLIISTGRYLRDYADGRAQEILRVYDDPQFVDLHAWRTAQNLPPYPDLAIISTSLNFDIPAVLATSDRVVNIFTVAQANYERIKALEAQGNQVMIVGETTVDGQRLLAAMAQLGYQTIYSAAGPKIMHMLLTARVLNRLYLTQAHRLLGGQPFASMVEGEQFTSAVGMRLNSLYYDPAGVDGWGQLFLSYNLA